MILRPRKKVSYGGPTRGLYTCGNCGSKAHSSRKCPALNKRPVSPPARSKVGCRSRSRSPERRSTGTVMKLSFILGSVSRPSSSNAASVHGKVRNEPTFVPKPLSPAVSSHAENRIVSSIPRLSIPRSFPSQSLPSFKAGPSSSARSLSCSASPLSPLPVTPDPASSGVSSSHAGNCSTPRLSVPRGYLSQSSALSSSTGFTSPLSPLPVTPDLLLTGHDSISTDSILLSPQLLAYPSPVAPSSVLRAPKAQFDYFPSLAEADRLRIFCRSTEPDTEISSYSSHGSLAGAGPGALQFDNHRSLQDQAPLHLALDARPSASATLGQVSTGWKSSSSSSSSSSVPGFYMTNIPPRLRGKIGVPTALEMSS
ncbi:hypothetical protein C8J57DRAFT_1735070 [Mycena rebaudengoi]|nr:hypothetical protein C8J57DRAFT_1735070 [Mycena rebaudengoi]